MKHIFIINPAAGKGQSVGKMLPQLHKYMKESGLDYELHRSLNKNDIVSWVSQRAASGEEMRFYAVGGDGTVNDVLCGMFGYPNAELAVIPCGSGNDFVKNFTGKENFLNIETQIQGTAVPVDVLKFNDSYAINMLNVGTDCDIAAESVRLRAEKHMKGAASYAAAAISILSKGGSYHMKYLDADGSWKEDDLLLVAVGNGKACGGGFYSCPRAKINDGLMDIGIVRPVKGLTLGRMLVKYHNGTHLEDKDADKYVTYFQAKEFFLSPADDFNICVDGEIEPFTETHFTILPGAVKVSIPKGSEML